MLYNNNTCFNVPKNFISTADELKTWLLSNNFPARIYFDDKGIISINYAKEFDTSGDGYASDLWGSADLSFSKSIDEAKEIILAHYTQFPTYSDYAKYDKNETQKRIKQLKNKHPWQNLFDKSLKIAMGVAVIVLVLQYVYDFKILTQVYLNMIHEKETLSK